MAERTAREIAEHWASLYRDFGGDGLTIATAFLTSDQRVGELEEALNRVKQARPQHALELLESDEADLWKAVDAAIAALEKR